MENEVPVDFIEKGGTPFERLEHYFDRFNELIQEVFRDEKVSGDEKIAAIGTIASQALGTVMVVAPNCVAQVMKNADAMEKAVLMQLKGAPRRPQQKNPGAFFRDRFRILA